MRRSDVLFALLSGSSLLGACEDRTVVTRREQMLKQLESKPRPGLRFQSPDLADPARQKFVDFYRDHIWPTERKLYDLGFEISLYRILIDRALYQNNEQKKEWQELGESARVFIATMEADVGWKRLQTEWASLAQDFTGDLADYARSNGRQVLLSFDGEDLPKFQRLAKLETMVSDLQNTSPFGRSLEQSTAQEQKALAQFQAGQISLAEVVARIKESLRLGRLGRGQDVFQRGRAFFDEAARLRTDLARSKGFSTPALYEMARQRENYSERFQSVESRVAFLEEILIGTDLAYKKVMRQRLWELGLGQDISAENMPTLGHLDLLRWPESSLVNEYFPKEKLVANLDLLMARLGLSEDPTPHLVYDLDVRAEKYTGAYFWQVNDPEPREYVFDVRTLNFVEPEDSEKDWFPSFAYVLMSPEHDGIEALRLGAHEYGHRSHFPRERDGRRRKSSYSRVETPSTLVERSLDNADLLVAIGEKPDGSKLPRALAETYVAHRAANRLFQLRYYCARALFDLKLWNQAYTEESPGYTEVAANLYSQLMKKYMGLESGYEGIDPGMEAFTSRHFWTAEINYWGYVGGEVAAENLKAFAKKFELAEGNQEHLGPLMQPYFRSGQGAFPEPEEKFTGIPFEASTFAKKVSQECEQHLKK